MKKSSIYQQCLWMLMAFVFMLGIFSRFTTDYHRYGFLAEAQMQAGGMQSQQTAKVLPIENLHEIDDFNINFAVRKGQKQESETAKGMMILIVIVALMLFFNCIERYRIFFGERKIPYFQIIRFIHRMDGKKKFCFAA
ncbi:MAG: hypothetical protein J6A92_06925 [Lachnospiraceae bacterium]|nr:hypothetical protein [Lachnospiraceae bacterium]